MKMFDVRDQYCIVPQHVVLKKKNKNVKQWTKSKMAYVLIKNML